MSTLRLTDSTGVTLLTAETGPGSLLARYFEKTPEPLVAGADLAAALARPVTALTAPLGAAFSFAQGGEVGGGAAGWNVAAGATAAIEVAGPGAVLAGEESLGDPAPAGHALVALTLSATGSAGLAGAVAGLPFGFTAGGAMRFRAVRRVAVAPEEPTLAGALEGLLGEARVPGSIAELEAMREGDRFWASAEGTLRCQASFDVARAFNPAASVHLPAPVMGAVRLETGASLKVGASASFLGSYQVRVERLGGAGVRVEYARLRRSTAAWSVSAEVRATAAVEGSELVERALGRIGLPAAEVRSLVAAGLPGAHLERLAQTIAASLDRSLAVSLSGAGSVTREASRLFAFDFDLDELEAEGREALAAALRGDLAPLTGAGLPAGVRLRHSAVKETAAGRSEWKLNFLGLVNLLSVSELIRQGEVLYSTETGELTITDTTTARRIQTAARPGETDAKRLHQALMQSLVFTAAWRAGGGGTAESLGASMSYFEQHAPARTEHWAAFGRNVAALGLGPLAGEAPEDAAASLSLDATFDDAAFRALFLAGDGRARKREEYAAIGRRAVAWLIDPAGPWAYRRLPMLVGEAGSDALWERMCETGQPGFASILPAPYRAGHALALLTHDYSVIAWWAGAMARTAEAVAAVTRYLASGAAGPEALASDPHFMKLREQLGRALGAVAKESMPDFLEAWGMIVMDEAAGRRARIGGTLLAGGAAAGRWRRDGGTAE